MNYFLSRSKPALRLRPNDGHLTAGVLSGKVAKSHLFPADGGRANAFHQDSALYANVYKCLGEYPVESRKHSGGQWFEIIDAVAPGSDEHDR